MACQKSITALKLPITSVDDNVPDKKVVHLHNLPSIMNLFPERPQKKMNKISVVVGSQSKVICAFNLKGIKEAKVATKPFFKNLDDSNP